MRIWAFYRYALDGCDPNDLYDPQEPFEIRISDIESSVVEVEITRQQTGWQALASGSPTAVMIGWSETGHLADVEIIAVGYLAEVPGDLLARTQTTRWLCSTKTVDIDKLAFAKEHLDDANVDFLFADETPDDADSYLLARSDVFRVDPVTHAVSTHSEIEGDRVVDLSDLALADGERLMDKPGVYPPPTGTLRGRITVGWTQKAEGSVDIGAFVGQTGGFTSLDPNIGQNLANYVLFGGAEGWTMVGGSASPTNRTLVSVSVGSQYRVNRAIRYTGNVYKANDSVEAVFATVTSKTYPRANSSQVTQEVPSPVVEVQPVLIAWAYEIDQLTLSYRYEQQRSETAFVALDGDVPASVASSDDAEVIEVALDDIFADNAVLDWQPGPYVVGDRVIRNGRYYECVEDHESEYFDAIRPGWQSDPIDYSKPRTRTFWRRVWPDDVADPATATRFFETDRGGRAIEHFLRRLRKEWLRRLRARHVVLTYRWQDAAHVRIEDSIRFLVPWGDGTYRTATGKVYSIDREWTGKSQPTVTIEVGVMFGTGVDSSNGGDDIDWNLNALAPPQVPVAGNRLAFGDYALLEATVENDANDQIAALPDHVVSGGEVGDVSVSSPTTLRVQMRDLTSLNLPDREIDVVGQLKISPGGVAL